MKPTGTLLLSTIALGAIALPALSTNFGLDSNVIASATRPPAQAVHGVTGVVGQAIATPMATFSSAHRLRPGYVPIIFNTGILKSPDTDNDGMPDSFEMTYGLSPSNGDAALDHDNDRLANFDEYLNGTDPMRADTDADQMPDGWEVRYGLDPTGDDAGADEDGDGYSNLTEYTAQSDPTVPDEMPTNARAWKNILPLLL